MKSFLFLSFFILDFALSLNTNIISSLLSLKDLNEQSKFGIHYDPIEEKEKQIHLHTKYLNLVKMLLIDIY